MLSHPIDFRVKTGRWQPTLTLSSKFQTCIKALQILFPNFSAPSCPNVSERGNGMMSRLPHFEANKANLLYFGLGSESVIVIFANYRSMRCYYRACTSKLCMLTYRFYVLSNPVTPGESISLQNYIQYSHLTNFHLNINNN